jgi:alpha-glucoside transport system substrate-binding protein
MRELANEGRLLPLDGILDMATITQEYSPSWIELGTVNDSLYAIFMKATNKGIIWYDPQVFQQNNWQIPESWDELIQLSDTIASGSQTPDFPWSVGVEAGQASGFPGTDWIAQIFLGEFGGDVYDQWVNHEIPWTDPRVKAAWEKFGRIVHTEGYIPGGATTALSTNFQDASYLPFQDPPQAAMYYEGDFVQGFLAAQFPDQVAGQDYAFFAFPPVNPAGAAPAASPGAPGASPPAGPTMQAPGASPPAVPSPGASPAASPLPQVPVTGGADLVVAFNDTPAVRSFVEYLSTAEAQEIWVQRGGFTSVNNQVSLDAYPNELARQSAEMLINAPVFRYGAGDVMPSAVQTAWWQGVLQYLQNQDQLDSILEGIEAQAVTAYQQQQ